MGAPDLSLTPGTRVTWEEADPKTKWKFAAFYPGNDQWSVLVGVDAEWNDDLSRVVKTELLSIVPPSVTVTVTLPLAEVEEALSFYAEHPQWVETKPRELAVDRVIAEIRRVLTESEG